MEKEYMGEQKSGGIVYMRTCLLDDCHLQQCYWLGKGSLGADFPQVSSLPLLFVGSEEVMQSSGMDTWRLAAFLPPQVTERSAELRK